MHHEQPPEPAHQCAPILGAVAKPCKGCPFARETEPGELGGGNPLTFIGQAHGPFWLPCHSAGAYAAKESDPAKVPQCAGAAIYRTHTGRDALMPSGIAVLPADRERVFSNPTEFLAHHTGLSMGDAAFMLRISSPDDLLLYEFSQREMRLLSLRELSERYTDQTEYANPTTPTK